MGEEQGSRPPGPDQPCPAVRGTLEASRILQEAARQHGRQQDCTQATLRHRFPPDWQGHAGHGQGLHQRVQCQCTVQGALQVSHGGKALTEVPEEETRRDQSEPCGQGKLQPFLWGVHAGP